MTAARVRALTAAALTVALAAGAGAAVKLARSPVTPALILRGDDAHRMLDAGLGAHVDRLLHDRAPARTGDDRLVALTFDDGPYAVETPLLLDELRSLGVHATFFLVGDDARLFPDLARRIEQGGDEIANHTKTHPADFEALSPAAVTAELRGGRAELEGIVRDPSIATMTRPPHGRFTERTIETAQADGYDTILWNDDPGDWRAAATPAVLLDHVARHATAPDILLLHSGRLNSVEALPEIVGRFRRAGFRFVTVGELLRSLSPAQIVHPEKLRV